MPCHVALKKRPKRCCVVLRTGRGAGRGEARPFSRMWNLLSRMWNLLGFYLYLTRVYATHDGLKGFDHFLCCPIDGMRRRD
jgi:hypothetical protein